MTLYSMICNIDVYNQNSSSKLRMTGRHGNIKTLTVLDCQNSGQIEALSQSNVMDIGNLVISSLMLNAEARRLQIRLN